MNINQIYNEDCQEGIKCIPNASVDCILTDPPYLYLKGQKLEREFDEKTLFQEFKRVLKPDGFVVLFGRGTSFYRWNTILVELGFTFKEEIVWDKRQSTSALLPIARKHETISIHCKSNRGKIRFAKVPYDEIKDIDNKSLIQDAKRVISYIRNNEIEELQKIVLGSKLTFNSKVAHKSHVSTQNGFNGVNPALSIVYSIKNGCKERDIITVLRDHRSSIHPTQKPVRLLERLLALTTRPGDIVLDPFSGSCSTAIACTNTNRQYIGFEIDSEYYAAGVKRLSEVLSAPKLAM